MFLHYGDMTDTGSLIGLLRSTWPREVYNLAAQSHVAVSFQLRKLHKHPAALIYERSLTYCV